VDGATRAEDSTLGEGGEGRNANRRGVNQLKGTESSTLPAKPGRNGGAEAKTSYDPVRGVRGQVTPSRSGRMRRTEVMS
jgi:hypothetical protein